MKAIKLSLIGILGILIISCAAVNSNKAGITVKGSITDATNMKVFFDKILFTNSAQVIAQSDTDSKGNFAIDFEEKLEPGIYRVRIGTRKGVLILDGTESKVEIAGDLASLSNFQFELKGSESSKEYSDMILALINKKVDIAGIQEFLKTCKNPLAGMQIALESLGGRPDMFETYKLILPRLEKAYPESEYTTQYSALVKQLEATYAMQMSRQKIKVGEPAPNISMANPDGKIYELADLKGQVVLLDFWASWCGPCRRANPHVVDVYDRYKDKGFTVFSVSLDGLDGRTKARIKSPEAIAKNLESSKSRWIQAIEKDNLKWDYHVSDLAKWDTQAAKVYGVTGIPKTFLIDRDGKISAVNPRYNLEEALVKIL
jgi:thiol-disulfide isomerase/thioredoxin